LLLPDPKPSELEIVTTKLKRHKSPGSDQIPTELIRAGGEKLQSQVHKLINSVWSKEKLPAQWEFIVVPIYEKGNNSDCSHYQGMSLVLTSYKIVSSIHLSRLNPYVVEIFGGSSVWVST
jgi:hypothetical protein